MESGTTVISPNSLINWGAIQPTLVGPPWQALGAFLGCPLLPSTALFNCIKKAPALKIKDICEHQRLQFPTVVADNETVYSDSIERRRTGNIAKVPLLTGSNTQEFRLFIAIFLTSYVPPLNPAELATQLLAALLPNSAVAAEARERYPTGNLGILTDLDAIQAIGTDLTFNCPSLIVANDSAHAGIPTWRYVYNGSWPNTQVFKDAGVFHSSEISMVFQEFVPGLALTNPPPTDDQLRLSTAMQTAWADFAKDPQKGPGWDQYEASPYPQTFGDLGWPDKGAIANINATENDMMCNFWNPLIIAASNTDRSNPSLPGFPSLTLPSFALPTFALPSLSL